MYLQKEANVQTMLLMWILQFINAKTTTDTTDKMISLESGWFHLQNIIFRIGYGFLQAMTTCMLRVASWTNSSLLNL